MVWAGSVSSSQWALQFEAVAWFPWDSIRERNALKCSEFKHPIQRRAPRMGSNGLQWIPMELYWTSLELTLFSGYCNISIGIILIKESISYWNQSITSIHMKSVGLIRRENSPHDFCGESNSRILNQNNHKSRESWKAQELKDKFKGVEIWGLIGADARPSLKSSGSIPIFYHRFPSSLKVRKIWKSSSIQLLYMFS